MSGERINPKLAGTLHVRGEGFAAVCNLTYGCPPWIIASTATDCFDAGVAIELPEGYALLDIYERIPCPCGFFGQELFYSKELVAELAEVGKALLSLREAGRLPVHLTANEVNSIKLLIESAE
jgi:hypothetical protein